jgi:hypothetical protein
LLTAYCPFWGRSPSGRAIRCNLFLPQAQHKKSISAAIPNAGKLKAVFPNKLKNGFLVKVSNKEKI